MKMEWDFIDLDLFKEKNFIFFFFFFKYLLYINK